MSNRRGCFKLAYAPLLETDLAGGTAHSVSMHRLRIFSTNNAHDDSAWQLELRRLEPGIL